MKVLGVSAYYHDSAAALVVDGQVIAAAEEERFNREKHTKKLPVQAIQYCLECAYLSPAELDIVAFFVDAKPWPPRTIIQLLHNSTHWLLKNGNTLKHGLAWLAERPQDYRQIWGPANEESINVLFWASILKREFQLNGRKRPLFLPIPHHFAHAASAFLAGELADAAILSADGRGEWLTTTLATGHANKITPHKEIGLPDSLGFFYGAITEFLGFHALGEEGKVMGLSAYGKPHYQDAFSRFLQITPDGLYKLNTRYIDYPVALRTGYFPQALRAKLGEPRPYNSPLVDRHANIAASLQQRFEEALLAMSGALARYSSSRNLCLTGGAMLNSAAAGRLLRDTNWHTIYVPPAPGDAGTAVGAAVYATVQANPAINIAPAGAYLGPDLSRSSILRAITAANLPYEERDDTPDYAAHLLNQGYVIGWCQGRMEYGARALGNRSILADPRQAETRNRVNRIKNREQWRPLAPSILAERDHEWFVEKGSSPYMSFVKTVRPEKAAQIAGCVHVDGTARVQTVSAALNPRYWQLIRCFEKLSEIPILLNTSFNDRGEPIVCTAADAVRSFQRMALDYLILGDFVLRKPRHSSAP